MVDVLLADAPDGVDRDAWGAACAAVRAYCGWHVAPSVTEDVTVDGSGSSVQVLPTLHLTALHSITNDGSAVAEPEWSASGMVRRGGCWTSRWRGVTARITHGYDACPLEVLDIVAEMVASAPSRSVSSVASGGHSVTYEPTMSTRQRAVLDLYRRPELA